MTLSLLVARDVEQLDPVWALRPNHVHYLLSVIVDYWADELDIPATPVPDPLPSKIENREVVIRAALTARAESLSFLRERPTLSVSPDSRGPGPERLCASVLWEAVRDWADCCCSPLAVDHRRALQSYWWLMGLPFNHPKGMPSDCWQESARKHYRIPAEEADPLPRLGLRWSSLFTMRARDPVPPPPFAEEGSYLSFLTCCGVLGISPIAARRYVHTVSPDL